MNTDAAVHKKTVVVHVRYLGSKRQFVEHKASSDQTLAELKLQVLDFFELVQEGGKVYNFAQDTTQITNLSITLGELAGEKHEVKLDLIEQLEQGA